MALQKKSQHTSYEQERKYAMKKLKQMSGPYSIGFELSSTAHGFVATDPNGNVLYHGKQPVMGTRVFKEGQHAAEARMPRTSRRGIQRRRGREHEMDATVRKQAEADRYAAEQKADAELYTRTKNAEAAKVEAQNKSDADLYSAQKTAEGVSAKAKAEAEATRLKGEADGAAEKAHGEGVAAGIKAQTEAYNGMENAYLLANRYIDVMPEVAEAVAKPLTAVDSIKMYGDGNATKLVRDTTGMVDQVTSGLKDATGIDLTELLSSFHQPFQPREDNE